MAVQLRITQVRFRHAKDVYFYLKVCHGLQRNRSHIWTYLLWNHVGNYFNCRSTTLEFCSLFIRKFVLKNNIVSSYSALKERGNEGLCTRILMQTNILVSAP